jgi:3-dehydroquinate synthase
MNSQLLYMSGDELLNRLTALPKPWLGVVDRKVEAYLPASFKLSPGIFWLEHPEQHKTPEGYLALVNFFLQHKITRTDRLLAIGGGATADLTGFVAATILRGIDWVAVPTTLLGMVDACLGGKTGINSVHGKNLVGAFHPPREVWTSLHFLQGLPDVEMQSGKGEILKYAMLSAEIRKKVLARADLQSLILACADYKMQVVRNDPKENKERISLNLGHTLGHAFESVLQIPHGLAVAMGLGLLLEVLEEKELWLRWRELVVALDLPQAVLSFKNYPAFDLQNFLNYVSMDKKNQCHKVRLVLPLESEGYRVLEMALAEFQEKIKKHADSQT